MPAELTAALRAAIDRRAPLIETLIAEGTTAWRLFHGTVEGRPGLTVDRYGDYILVQTFRDPLTDAELAAIEAAVDDPVAWRHRGTPRVETPVPSWSTTGKPFSEGGVIVSAPLVHRGQDPLLFLDFRAGRRWLAAHSEGKRVLNTFAYTGFAGLRAAAMGARKVTQLDHGKWCLRTARQWSTALELDTEIVREDFFAAARQWAGLRVKGRGAQKSGWTRRPERRFDLVVLDPPTFSSGNFGAVDIERDYGSLAKPCLLMLAEGGTLLATNHSPKVDRDTWIAGVQRTAEKAGRPVTAVELIEPDGDFPTFDGQPPLKMAAFTV